MHPFIAYEIALQRTAEAERIAATARAAEAAARPRATPPVPQQRVPRYKSAGSVAAARHAPDRTAPQPTAARTTRHRTLGAGSAPPAVRLTPGAPARIRTWELRIKSPSSGAALGLDKPILRRRRVSRQG
jgi:hypothetical protein